ncbi:MAG: hypothetical protein R6X10_13620 [Desulfobacterales bacterium]
MPEKKTAFDADEIAAFKPEEKIGLVASVNPEGRAHISLITSIQAAGPNLLTLGEFCKGKSKEFIQKTRKVGFLIMTLDRKMWRGKARWTHLRKDGPEFEAYNNLPMFRYNAYFGINTVHYLDLVETTEKENLPLPNIVYASLLTKFAKGGLQTRNTERILRPFAEDIFNRLDALKFIAWVSDDGFPVIVPLLQCQASDSRRLAFSTHAYKNELKRIPKGKEVAVFGLTMKMEDVLVRGKFLGFQHSRFIEVGGIDIEWVYNSMPPCHGQIYPEVALKPVVNF